MTPDQIYQTVISDNGLQYIVEQLVTTPYGNGQVGFKTHKGHIAQVSIPKATSARVDGWKGLLAYIVEKGKSYQNNCTKGERSKLTFTVDINDRGEVERLTEDEYKTKHFSVPI